MLENQFLARLLYPFMTLRGMVQLRLVSHAWNNSIVSSPHWDEERYRIFGPENIREMDAQIDHLLRGHPERPRVNVTFNSIHATVARLAWERVRLILTDALDEEGRNGEIQFDPERYANAMKRDDEKKNAYRSTDNGDGGSGIHKHHKKSAQWITVQGAPFQVSTRPAFFRFIHRCAIHDTLDFHSSRDRWPSILGQQVFSFITGMFALSHPKSSRFSIITNLTVMGAIRELISENTLDASRATFRALGIQGNTRWVHYFQ
jgi:hypothetical protein